MKNISVEITVTEEPTKRYLRSQLKQLLQHHADFENMTVRQRQPWTFVEFRTFEDADGPTIDCWGISKVCHPDQWSAEHGVDLAIDRALAWAVREIIPPVVE